MKLRQVLSHQIDFDRIEKMLENGETPTVKFGIDPTTPDMHIGHLVPIMLLKRLIQMGCKADIVIGDMTATIGDPSGKDKSRPTLSISETSLNATSIMKSLEWFLDEPIWTGPASINGDRLNTETVKALFNSSIQPTTTELIELLGRVSVNSMLMRDHFSKRFEGGDSIKISEMICPVLQAWDSIVLKPDIEIGGNDQLANCHLARSLMDTPQAIALVPLLIGTDGTNKMSKTLNNHISLNDSPDDVFGKTMSIPDELVDNWSMLLFHDTIKEKDPLKRKELLGIMITKLLHDEETALEARTEFDRRFRKREITPQATLSFDGPVCIADVIKDAQWANSNGEVRRLIQGNGIKVDGSTVNTPEHVVSKNCLVTKGKRNCIELRFS